jgi:hypothetical protein
MVNGSRSQGKKKGRRERERERVKENTILVFLILQ